MNQIYIILLNFCKNSLKPFSAWISAYQNYVNSIPADDLISRQRFRLFRITTITASAVILYAYVQALMVMESGNYASTLIGCLAALLLLNYFALPYHRNHKLAYYTITLGAFATLHLITYYSGGIRASAVMHMAGTMLLGYMLLGKKAGRIVFALVALHLCYFWWLSEYTDLINHVLIGDTDSLINIDYLTTFLLSMFILSSQMSYLESGKNEVITRITEQRNELHEKNRELNKLSIVASKADNAIVITDRNGIAEWVNDGFVRLTGFEPSEVIGKRTMDVLHGKHTSPEARLQLLNAIQSHQSFAGELLKYKKDGTPFWTQLNMTPIRSEDGSELRFILIESDVTPRKIAEEKMRQYMKSLEKSNAELDKFAYVVSHDLKAPLRAIGSLAGWVVEDMGDDLSPETKTHLDTIQGRVVRMEGLINGILDYAKAAKKVEDQITFDSGELVKETIDLLGPPVNAMISIRGDWPVVTAHRVKLQQVFINLVQNALKYNDKQDIQIELGCADDGDFYKYYVRDNGPGIEPRYHDRIFVIFQTLNARDEVESRGVGLAIVKKIIEDEGGSISVDSDAGLGAKFTFTWPKVRKVSTEVGLIEDQSVFETVRPVFS